MSNPALSPFDLTSYEGTLNKNFFEANNILWKALKPLIQNQSEIYKKDLYENLSKLGKLIGSKKIQELTENCHKEGKYGELVKYNKNGERIDEIRYSVEQKELRKIFYDFGLINLDKHPEWKHEFTLLHGLSFAILLNMNGECGVTCPLTMTDGLIRGLKAIGTEKQKAKFLPLLTDLDSTSHFMAGQYVTERVGGSNVGANRTIATKVDNKGGTSGGGGGGGDENTKWLLNGEKWFCSNPGDVWVTTARIGNEKSSLIGLFLVSRFKENGELNGCIITRKKDIIGSKGKLTVEVYYENCEAQPLGRTSHGLSNLIRYILGASRQHVICGALGYASRAIFETQTYVSKRTAYQKKLANFPVVQKSLAEVNMLLQALTLCALKSFYFVTKNNPLELLFIPLLKTVTSQYSTLIIKECIILFGGNGILNDFSVLPRLLNDSIINETWEGGHALLASHALSAFKRNKVIIAWKNYLEENKNLSLININITEIKRLIKELEEGVLDDYFVDVNRTALCEKIFRIFALHEIALLYEREENDSKLNALSMFEEFLYFTFNNIRMTIISNSKTQQNNYINLAGI